MPRPSENDIIYLLSVRRHALPGLNNLGNHYFARGAYQKAAEHFEQAMVGCLVTTMAAYPSQKALVILTSACPDTPFVAGSGNGNLLVLALSTVSIVLVFLILQVALTLYNLGLCRAHLGQPAVGAPHLGRDMNT